MLEVQPRDYFPDCTQSQQKKRCPLREYRFLIFRSCASLGIGKTARQPTAFIRRCNGVRGNPEQSKGIQDAVGIGPERFREGIPTGVKNHREGR